MTPDPEYLKGLLTAFRDSPEPTTDIEELAEAGFSYADSSFFFHMLLLRDQGFVTDDDDNSLGIDRGAGGDVQWSVIPLRLTAGGHEFADALGNNKVMAVIKKSFAGVSISTMSQVASSLLKGEITQHLHGLRLP
jgi:hypothetical protein